MMAEARRRCMLTRYDSEVIGLTCFGSTLVLLGNYGGKLVLLDLDSSHGALGDGGVGAARRRLLLYFKARNWGELLVR